MSLLATLDYASVFVFALTGALVASRAQLDIVGFAFIACLTAVGGGTIRDVLLDRDAVFWIEDPWVIGVAVGAAVFVFFTAHFLESRYRVLVWLDAVALSVAVSAGVAVAQSLDQTGVVTVIMGMITGCMGGLMRDVVCNEVPLVLKQGELYATSALGGALAGVLALHWGLPQLALSLICGATVFLLRAGSLTLGWRLPVYKSRPPRQ